MVKIKCAFDNQPFIKKPQAIFDNVRDSYSYPPIASERDYIAIEGFDAFRVQEQIWCNIILSLLSVI